MERFAITCAIAVGWEAIAIASLFLLPRGGEWGRKLGEAWARSPGLDFVLAATIWLPWLVGFTAVGWVGLFATVVGQILALQIWIAIHERIHAQAASNPRIVSYLNKRFGWWRNNLALWVTTPVLPVFFLIRLSQVSLYPLLVALLGFPTYNHSDWINVSRQKFDGLVGHDLIWCLYCDWMTGVYSLGAEMLRNVESFWCPIRFYNDKKCENCRLDFPDIDEGWVAADGTMQEVVQTLQEKMPSDRPWSWFGHPDRQK